MAEPHRVELLEVLTQIARDVGADGGATLYLDEGDGVLEQVASTVPATQPPERRDWLGRFRSRPTEAAGNSLVLSVPDSNGGVLVLERRSAEEFSHHDRAVARMHARRLVDQVAVAAGQLRSSVWARQLEAVQRVAARLTRLTSLDELGAAICAETRRIIDCDEAHVVVFGAGGRQRTVAVSGAPVAADGRPQPLPCLELGGDEREGSGASLAAALREARPLLRGDLRDLDASRPGEWSLLLAPLHFEGQAYGAICLLRRGAGRFSDSHQRILHIIADQAAVAVANTRLLAGRDQLVEGLGVLLEISQAAGEASSERHLGARLAYRLREATGVDACVIWRREETSTVLRSLGRSGCEGPDLLADSADLPARRAVLTDGRPRLVNTDSPDDAGPEADALAALGGRTLLLMPLQAGGPPFGLVELISFASRSYGEAEMSYIQTMTSLASTGLERARLLEQLRLAADVDPLTGVHNNRYLRTRLRQEVARAARNRAQLTVLLLDLDNFKPVNDAYGHAEGDRLLARIAATIKAHVRAADIVARYGGDEFVVVMPDTAADRARVVARRVVRGITSERHAMADGTETRVGVSAGLAVYPTEGRTAAALLAAADAQMYSAKRAGRGGLAGLGAGTAGKQADAQSGRAAAG
ncbi:MAG TPA: diguanylate cyclase [Candidatus Limnocylindria bacterium]|nr:diguanylate cyclase [Candidatus Limnocylindria bacterium]